MLHSYYTMPIILYRGGVPTTYTVRWYKAPVGAKYLAIPSCIFSHVWDNNPGESIPGEVGEVGAPRTWDKGDNRGGYQGQCFRGDPAWFATGKLPGVLPAPDPSCLCSIPPAVASGGMMLGGAATPAVGNPCQAWAGRAPQLDQFDGSGAVTMRAAPGGVNFYLPATVNPSYVWVAQRGNLACGGSPARWLMVLALAGTFAVQNGLILSGLAVGQTVGLWFNPTTSVALGGAAVRLFT